MAGRQSRRRLSAAGSVYFPCGVRCREPPGCAAQVRNQLPSSQEPAVPHINVGNDEFGIRSLLKYRPETALPMGMLAEVLMRGPGTLTPGERELIAAYVSSRNECGYCTASHAASASVRLP